MHLKVGTLLKGGTYRVEKVLGQGGFGITYLAEQSGLNRKVAVKEFFMKEHCNRDADTSFVSVPSYGSRDLVDRFMSKFIKEAQTIALMDNHHIITIHDVFEENGTAYYVMEYLSCGSLSEKIPYEGLPESEAVGYIRQIADALSYIHQNKILHLDIKPSNILFRKADEAVLIDFGISKHYDEEEGSQTSSTPVGVSEGYAPTEQYEREGVSSFAASTDIYSLGATLYCLLSGHRPPKASIVLNDGLPPLPSSVSDPVRNAVEKAMSPRRKDRPQTVSAFLRLLEVAPARRVPPIVVDEETQCPEQVKPEHASPKPRHRGLIWGVAAGIVAVIAIFLCRTNFEIEKPGDILSASSAVDLTDGGETANSYIVSTSGTYKFKPVKGNSSISVGSVSSVEVLWESFGTDVTPSEGDLVKDVSYADGYIQFSTPSSFREGNAVIAAKNSSGEILWSWHIWLTDQPKGQTYYNNAGTMMDRNLGATSADAGDVGALGLLYQWGRKDPFLGSSSISGSTEAKSTKSWPSPVSASTSKGTVDYATENPMTFITFVSSSSGDWHYSSRNNDLWKSSKTIYDPCPVGWRVPDGGDNGVWSKACGSSYFSDYPYDSSDEGMNFSGKFGSASIIWYPASGHRSYNDGSLDYVGFVYYWSVSPYSSSAYALYFDDNGDVNPSSYCTRARGLSVRCLKISEIDGGNEGFGGSDYEW